MKLQYRFTFLFVLKVVLSHPTSCESGLQSENTPGSGENGASDIIPSSILDDSHTTTEKRSFDSEGTGGAEIMICVKPFDSANQKDVIETFCSNTTNRFAEDVAKATENSLQSTTTGSQHNNTSSTEAYAIANFSLVNVIDPSTNLTTYNEYQDNTFAPFNNSYTSDISTGDIQDFGMDVHKVADLETVSAIALETRVPKANIDDSVTGGQGTHDDLLPSKSQDASRTKDFENAASETIVAAELR